MTIGKNLLTEFDHEMAGTRRVLERLPEGKLSWKIHDNSNTIGWNASHLADLPSWATTTIESNSLDLLPKDGEPFQVPTYRSIDEIMAAFDGNVARTRVALETVSDDELHKPWSLLKTGETIFTMPKIAVLRTWVMNHIIHHRAHLCVYMRVNDIPVPALYGPSGDEQ